MDWDEINDLLNSQIKENKDVSSGYEQIKKVLSDNNLPIAQINTNQILKEFKDWLIEVIEKEPIPKEIKSIYFGLSELSFPDIDDGQSKTTIYIAGSKSTPDEASDWNFDTEYLPKRRYLLLDDFEKIDNLKSESEISGDYEVLVFNGLLNLLVANTIKDLESQFLTYKIKKFGLFNSIKKREQLYFSAGFDSGDTYLIRHLKKE